MSTKLSRSSRLMVVAAVAAASSLVALKVLSARQLRDLPCAPDPPLATTSAITAVDPVLQMVLRSTDVRAALADLLAHDDGTHGHSPVRVCALLSTHSADVGSRQALGLHDGINMTVMMMAMPGMTL